MMSPGEDTRARGAGAARDAIVAVSGARARILELVEERPRPLAELARDLDLGKSGVHKHVQRLVREGAIMRIAGAGGVAYAPGPAAPALLRALRALREPRAGVR